jgi:cytochrome c-type biogenesis protein CcmH/NrfG
VKERKTEEAGQIVQALLKEDSSDPEAIVLEASLTVAKQDPDHVQPAIDAFQAVLARMPADFVLRYQYARALILAGDIRSAVIQCQEALRLRPDYLWPKVVLVHLALGADRAVEARTLIDEISANQGLNVPFETAGQRPQEGPFYEGILGVKPPVGLVLPELVAKLTEKSRQLGLTSGVPEPVKRQKPKR